MPADSSRLAAGESSPWCLHRASPLAVCLLPVKFSLYIYPAVVAKMPKAQPRAAFGLGVPKEAARTCACMVKRVLYLQRRTWTQFPCRTWFYVKIWSTCDWDQPLFVTRWWNVLAFDPWYFLLRVTVWRQSFKPSQLEYIRHKAAVNARPGAGQLLDCRPVVPRGITAAARNDSPARDTRAGFILTGTALDFSLLVETF